MTRFCAFHERQSVGLLTLAITEIREYGASSIQVMRRLRTLLEDLQESVRPENRPAVDAEIAKRSDPGIATFVRRIPQLGQCGERFAFPTIDA